MMNCLKTDIGKRRKILLEEIAQLFIKHFGKDKKENALFRRWLKLASERYDDDQLIERAAVIIDEGYHRALDLGKYIQARIFEISGKRKMSYDDALSIIGNRKLHTGEGLYHFSNRKHEIGYGGHIGMCFSSSPELYNVAANLDTSEIVYLHICCINNPRGLIDHDAKTIAETYSKGKMSIADLIREFIFDGCREARWYELKKEGAIRIIQIEKVR